MSARLVIKIGGSTLGSADTTYRDIATIAARDGAPVVVHGGGAEASRWLDAMRVPTRFERGLRVTDANVLPVVVAVFGGLVNKRIVAALNAAGVRAVGISGADGRLLECRMAALELGFVGEPVKVNVEPLEALLAAGLVPVVACLGVVPGEERDQLVNVNADTIAGEIAAALGADRVVYLTDVDGVRAADGRVVARLSGQEARALIADGTIAGGMIPKVEACLHALSFGVTAQIVDGRAPGALLALEGAGTLFEAGT